MLLIGTASGVQSMNDSPPGGMGTKRPAPPPTDVGSPRGARGEGAGGAASGTRAAGAATGTGGTGLLCEHAMTSNSKTIRIER